ncbi:C-X-C motif chemokine 16 isoform X2 [Nyctibius grandis]|uniref:C-X-C motif chemokine 16 isoform X2 n=1 Tax=Nyctibius grandis TaxID=48427 RepID=UPI0035BC24AD
MGLGLLLLLLPWGALGNVGGSAGACACTHRWPQEPPPGVRLPPLAPRVLRAERCPRHVVRFVLPHTRLCGLQDAPWVAELLQLWEHRDRPPDGPTDGPTDRPTDRPTETHRWTHGWTPGDRGTPGQSPRPTEPPSCPPSPGGAPPQPPSREAG